MNAQDLKKQVTELGLTFMRKVATTNSEYITIDGMKFRVSDHVQPSHYQIRNYVDCSNYTQILNYVLNVLEQRKIQNTWDEYLYCKNDDCFYKNDKFISENTKPKNYID